MRRSASYRRQFDLAIGEIGRAVELNPSDAEGYLYRGGFLVILGRSGEAVADLEIAKSLNPALPSAFALPPVGWAYYLQHRYQEAITTFAAGVRSAPNNYFVHAGPAASHAQLGSADSAVLSSRPVHHEFPG